MSPEEFERQARKIIAGRALIVDVRLVDEVPMLQISDRQSDVPFEIIFDDDETFCNLGDKAATVDAEQSLYILRIYCKHMDAVTQTRESIEGILKTGKNTWM